MKAKILCLLMLLAIICTSMCSCDLDSLLTGSGNNQCGHTDSDGQKIRENEVLPTCTNDGRYDEVIYCTECEQEIKRTTIIVEKLGHSIVDGQCSVCGETYFSQGLQYATNEDGTCEVIGIGSCEDADLVIPEKYENFTVTGIADSAFKECYQIVSVVIPDTVTSIGNGAFEDCSNLNKISLGNNTESIATNAFDGTSLSYSQYRNAYYIGNSSNPYLALVKAANLEIPSLGVHENTKVIADGALNNLLSLEAITVDENNKIYKAVNGVLYSKNGEILIKYPSLRDETEFVIPDGVKTIASRAFMGAALLKDITIPTGLEYVKSDAFSQCDLLCYVHFDGSTEEFNAINVESGNHMFTNAVLYAGDSDESYEYSYNYNWSETTIIMQLNMDDNYGELSSGTRRYYAGEDRTQSADIDKSIRKRNRAAETAANVKVQYAYLEDNEGYTWGTNVDDIQIKVKSGDADAPDIYCNFAYDMTCAALRDCFANLLNEDYANGNFFRFTDDDYDPTSDNYFDKKAGEGYFYQYMESLSLSPESRIYCLASNYCTDVIRSFVVIPVNVQMINSLDANAVANIIGANGDGDLNDDGKVDVLDFYEYVWAGEWTYDTLAKYSQLAYKNTSNASGGEDIGDTLGFVLGRGSGLTPSGILYSSSVKIITKNARIGTYEYGMTNAGLSALVAALYELMQTTGVTTATFSDFNTVLGYTPESELIGIRERFADNKILFGGITCVGSLEDTDYQEMREKLGFGVVPVPLYQKVNVNGEKEEYLTLVHNVARIVGISYKSEKFSQCSAFLDYQSRSSADILDQYYNDQLTAATGGVAGENNAKMLTYIRNHVRDCLDKTYEDIITMKILEDSHYGYNYRWHDIIMDNNYQMSDFRLLYTSIYMTKQTILDGILETWDKLRY